MYRGINAENVARKVSRRVKRGRPCYVYASSKHPGVMISVESQEEYRRGILLDIDPRVHSYREQPFTLELTTGQILQDRSEFKKKGRKSCFLYA